MGAPAGAHVLPGAGRPSPAGAFWAAAATPPERGRGSACLLLGAKARGPNPLFHPLRLLSVARVRLAPGGAPGRKFAGSRRSSGRGRARGPRGTPGEPATAPGPPPGQPRPTLGRRCGRAGPCVPADAESSLGTGQRPGPCAARRPRAVADRACVAVSRCVRTRLLTKAPGPSETGFSSVPRLPGRPPAAAAHPDLILWGGNGLRGGNSTSHRVRGSSGSWW